MNVLVNAQARDTGKLLEIRALVTVWEKHI